MTITNTNKIIPKCDAIALILVSVPFKYKNRSFFAVQMFHIFSLITSPSTCVLYEFTTWSALS